MRGRHEITVPTSIFGPRGVFAGHPLPHRSRVECNRARAGRLGEQGAAARARKLVTLRLPLPTLQGASAGRVDSFKRLRQPWRAPSPRPARSAKDGAVPGSHGCMKRAVPSAGALSPGSPRRPR